MTEQQIGQEIDPPEGFRQHFGLEGQYVAAPSANARTELENEVFAAEAAHQASLCVSPDDLAADDREACSTALAEALDLRVEVNLAQHDGAVRRVGHTDPRVRELEAPWTRKARRATGSTR